MKRGILAIVLMSAPLLGDDVYLKGGGQVSGVIVEQTESSITVDIGGGNLTVKMSTVVRIEKTTSPLHVYRERAAGIAAGDAEAWRELARWAERESLATQARNAWTQVATIAPGDPEANRALGRVELNGVWVTEEESYLARGFVEFEGDWMMPAERQAILAERSALAESDRQALEAQIQAEQQADADRQAQEQAEHDEFWTSPPVYGDAVPWGVWGTGVGGWRPTTLPAGGRR